MLVPGQTHSSGSFPCRLLLSGSWVPERTWMGPSGGHLLVFAVCVTRLGCLLLRLESLLLSTQGCPGNMVFLRLCLQG